MTWLELFVIKEILEVDIILSRKKLAENNKWHYWDKKLLKYIKFLELSSDSSCLLLYYKIRKINLFNFY